MTKTETEEKIKFSVEMPKHANLGESLTAEFQLQNRSTSDIAISPPVDPEHKSRQIHVEIRGQDGNKIERTAIGDDVLKPAESVSSGPTARVAPSESHTWKLDLQPLFRLKQGKYILTASVEIVKSDGAKAHGDLVESKPTEFTIK